MSIEQKIVGTTRECMIGTMDRHAKTISLLFAIYMNDNACRIGPDLWQIKPTQWKEQHTTSDVYDIFVHQLTVENKVNEES